MKKIFAALLAVVMLSACNNDEPSVEHQLAFSVQSDFDNDEIVITVDGREVMRKVVTTNHTIGAALNGQAALNLVRGTHSVAIVVNGTGFLTSVTLDANLYIGINYDRDENKISIVESLQPFAYD
jgi:hypothetical protein